MKIEPVQNVEGKAIQFKKLVPMEDKEPITTGTNFHFPRKPDGVLFMLDRPAPAEGVGEKLDVLA